MINTYVTDVNVSLLKKNQNFSYSDLINDANDAKIKAFATAIDSLRVEPSEKIVKTVKTLLVEFI